MKKIPWYKSLWLQLPLLVMLCCALPVSLFAWYNNQRTSRSMMETARTSLETNLKSSSILLEDMMETVENFSADLCADEDLIRNMRIFLVAKERRDWARSNISLLLSQEIRKCEPVEAMYLVWEEGDELIATDLDGKIISTEDGWGHSVMNRLKNGGISEIAWQYMPEDGEHGGLTYVRPLQMGTNYRACALLCQVSESSWTSCLKNTYEEESAIMCDYSGKILLHTGAEAVFNVENSACWRQAFTNMDNSGSYEVQYDKVNYLVVYYTSVEEGWKYMLRVPTAEIFADIPTISQVSLWMLAVGILAAIIAFAFIQIRVHRPLRVLDEYLDRMEAGELEQIEKIRSRDEVGGILRKYNHMIGRLRRNIDEIYVQQLLRKQAQLNSLQSQMDEHFLYNTLNMIYCEACREHADSSARMMLILSRYFRLSLAKGRDKAPLDEIVELMKLYLAIQKQRFGGGLKVVMDIFPEHGEYQALKYLFQPIVENAIVHGFEKKLGNHLLKITLQREAENGEELLLFSVEDDGQGIPPEKLESLREEMHTFEKVEGEGFALKNIREQIRINYGEQYTIHIESEEGKGSRIWFRIPLEPVEKEEPSV